MNTPDDFAEGELITTTEQLRRLYGKASFDAESHDAGYADYMRKTIY